MVAAYGWWRMGGEGGRQRIPIRRDAEANLVACTESPPARRAAP